MEPPTNGEPTMNTSRPRLSRYFSITLSPADVRHFRTTSAFAAMFPTPHHAFMLDDAGIVTGADLRRGGFFISGEVEFDFDRMTRACANLRAQLALNSAKLISNVGTR